jgi:outer membrane protein assembly factor BamB
MRYSAARQIDRKNVAQLRVAWTHRTGALEVQMILVRKAAFEATPILVDGKLVLSTQYDHVIALDPQTGGKLWEYDPGVNLQRDYSEVASRGVSAWVNAKAKPGQACRLRIFIGTLDGRLIALDGLAGKPCVAFGANGVGGDAWDDGARQGDRVDQFGRADSDGGRPGVHFGHDRSFFEGVRLGNGKGTVEVRAAGRGAGNADDLYC